MLCNCLKAAFINCIVYFSFFSIRSSGRDNLQKDAIKSFRVLRVLRPLKAINKSKKLKVCVVFPFFFFKGSIHDLQETMIILVFV